MSSAMKMASCQISFAPVGITDYSEKIKQVLSIIESSGVEYDIGVMSTVISGEKEMIFALIKELYDRMDETCGFIMDVKISNVCGCD